MKPRKFAILKDGYQIRGIRKKGEEAIDDNRFRKALRLAKQRAALRTEHARLHGLYFEQISPHLRERVLQQGRHVRGELNLP